MFRGLLTILLCAEKYSLSRWRLAQLLWPHVEDARSRIHRLDVALSSDRLHRVDPELERRMLFVEEERRRITLRGPLWWDVAAFLTLVKEAETSQEQPEVALPLWQEAEQLSRRGLFLSDDLEAPWYELQAVRAVRLRIEKARQQVQRGLALGLFATAKALEEAHLQLQLYFEQYPTDRAAVEHLLHLADRSHQHQELVLDVLSQVQGRLDAATRARWPLFPQTAYRADEKEKSSSTERLLLSRYPTFSTSFRLKHLIYRDFLGDLTRSA
ncbi:hypothetical protein [Thermosporothrix hazakensis]|uniref:hypothetical protein n=1 Tax=Thermosporothrix hazakensis TaxID=644383 RepID=UPI0010F7E0EB|nr:hypothetical protein [Thermosporothrix hazakensis]